MTTPRAAQTPTPGLNRSLPESNRTEFRVAAIDVGSNSLHMVVAQADSDGSITTLWREKSVKIILKGRGDAELEIWAARNKTALFEKVFGRRVSFEGD